MPFQPIPNTARVTCVGRQTDAEVWANVFHVRWGSASPFSDTVRAEIVAAFTAFYEAMDDYWPDTTGLDRIDIRSIETEGSPTYSFPVTGVQGTAVANPLPPQVSPVISWIVGETQTRKKGRSYLPAPASNLTTDSGAMNEVMKDAFGAAGVALIDYLNDAARETESLVVVSRLGSGSAEDVTACALDQWYDTQRGRRDKLISSYERYLP